MENKIKDNLIALLILFNDKPQYLIKFLLDNNAFTKDFLTNVFNSIELNRLRNFNEDEKDSDSEDIFLNLPHFKNISDMNLYFKNIINPESEDIQIEQETIYNRINKELENNLKIKLKEYLLDENYEEAALIRDKMKELNIIFK